MLYNFDKYGKNVLVNSLTGKIAFFVGEAGSAIQNAMDGARTLQECYEFLKSNKFVVDSSINEDDLYHKMRDEAFANSDTLNLIIFVTGQCNFRCTYCCEDYRLPQISQRVQDEIIEFVEINVIRYKYMRVEWFGGEPLLHPHIIKYMSRKFIDACKSNRVNYYATITTNGYFLDEKVFKSLKDNLVLSYQVTLDGLREVHDKQRVLTNGGRSWDRIISNLKTIQASTTSSAFNIMIRVNITKEIYRTHQEFLRFLKKQFGSDKRFHFLWKLAEDWGNINEECKESLCGLKEYKEVVSYANELGLQTRFLMSTLLPGGRICEAAKMNSLVIFSDGTISKCARNVMPEESVIGNTSYLKEKASTLLATSFIQRNRWPNCKECIKKPLCLENVCPFDSTHNCGYELEDLSTTLETIMLTDPSVKTIDSFREKR